MKTLYLLRHAKSSWKFEELSDHDRPLKKRGRKDVPLIAQELIERKVNVDLIISSSAVRALSTATLMAKELGFDPEKIGVQEELYHITPTALLQFVQLLPDEYSHVMLVGHNPTFTEVANMYSPDKSIANLPTSGLAAIQFDVTYWGQVSAENGNLHFLDYPKKYR
ncbi:SixA phosphatase family protein [Rufibacter roseus]|uniref:SixA phosphatase family protein n=1 Tax=Rufibacter roseus TaxID=1567108 RepID=A0ABW2DH59_9BACT|nr:histidine phosphatase family protein [Rufibacter roseus]